MRVLLFRGFVGFSLTEEMGGFVVSEEGAFFDLVEWQFDALDGEDFFGHGGDVEVLFCLCSNTLIIDMVRQNSTLGEKQWRNIVVVNTSKERLCKTVSKTARRTSLSSVTVSDGRWTYTWDGENRLISIVARTTTGPQLCIKFEYDWQGRRIHKQVWTNTSGTGTASVDQKYLYDGWNVIAVLDTANTLKQSFAWGTDLSSSLQGAGGVGGLLWIKDTATISNATSCHFVAYDGNGNIKGLVNAADGTISARYDYGPFGELIRQTGPMSKANPIRFSTKYTDDETDLLYYGYRYYNPSTGRWLSRDPINEKGGLNLYVFLGNDGVDRVDFLGLRKVTITLFHPTTFTITATVKLDVDRILQDCVKKQGCGKHTAALNWVPTSNNFKSLSLGIQKTGIPFFRTVTGFNAYINPVSGGLVCGSSGGDVANVSMDVINKEAEEKHVDSQIVLSTTIAHEVFFHVIGGGVTIGYILSNNGHYYATGFIDAQYGKPYGVLSGEACRQLLDALDIGK